MTLARTLNEKADQYAEEVLGRASEAKIKGEDFFTAMKELCKKKGLNPLDIRTRVRANLRNDILKGMDERIVLDNTRGLPINIEQLLSRTEEDLAGFVKGYYDEVVLQVRHKLTESEKERRL